MKTAGILILVLGLIMIVSGIGMVVGSVFMLKSSVESALESRVVKTVPLTVDQSVTSDPIDVNREKMCQIAFQADLTGTDVKEKTIGDDVSYQLDYSIPFEVEVFDDTGKSIHRESSTLSSSGFVLTHNRNVDEDGGSETPRIMLGTFQAPASGKLSVTAKVGKNQVAISKSRRRKSMCSTTSRKVPRRPPAAWACAAAGRQFPGWVSCC